MTSTREGPVVTLDGPAGSGKSTTAKAVASRLGLRHLDSGALYRALTYALQEAGVPEERWERLEVGDFRGLGVELAANEGGFEVRLGDRVLTNELRSARVTSRVALLARLPAARACLLDLQRAAGEHGRLVADGRDMGTVVFPDADLKIYLVADLEERARRRLRDEGQGEPTEEALAEQVSSIQDRDRIDSAREISPLRSPDDAVEIDTTGLSFEEQVEAIVERVRRLSAG
ncbi:MAG TPA: (d)CMP kinase [Longimicrobiales bacterium]|nr:(d)CMP kinase [Longimicrobiales bacterium]